MSEQEPSKLKPVSSEYLERMLEESLSYAHQYTPASFDPRGLRIPNFEVIVGCASVLMSRSIQRQERSTAEMSACIQRQEEINRAILSESKAVKRLTWGVVILTAAVVGLTVYIIVKG
jgi:hypothetical protein